MQYRGAVQSADTCKEHIPGPVLLIAIAARAGKSLLQNPQVMNVFGVEISPTALGTVCGSRSTGRPEGARCPSGCRSREAPRF